MKNHVMFGCLMMAAWMYGGQGQMKLRPRALEMIISRFEVVDQTFESTLRELALRAGGNFVVGFEVAPQPAGGKLPNLRLTLENASVEHVLMTMCSLDRRYRYVESQPGVIGVSPVEERAQMRELMALPVPHLDLRVRQWFPNLFNRFPDFVPELGEYLSTKVMEWARRTGRFPPGTPGIVMRTNVEPPSVSIQLENTNVRGVLNGIAAYTLEHAMKDQEGRTTLGPVGWRVEFLPDPEAPTGLGGYVKWSAFP